jgi:RNA polymerase sigma-70 factor, ECF subfamily
MLGNSVTFRLDPAMNTTEKRIAVMEAKALLEYESDERLLIEAAQREPARFGELYDRNFVRIYAFFARRTATREEAQDLTAEVFHQALASIGNFKWQGAPFVAWLYGIAAHVLAGNRKKAGTSVEIEGLELSNSLGEIERSVMLGKLVDALAPEQRLVVVRRFIDQKSIREIALELRRSEGAVKQLQFRALQRLREKLGRRI